MDIGKTRGLALVIAVATTVPVSAAMALPQAAKSAAGFSEVFVDYVHGDWDGDEGYTLRRHHHRHPHTNERHVDAPFTHVESGRRVIVDAPFAHVRIGRHGRHVVAPFVNLWIPRKR